MDRNNLNYLVYVHTNKINGKKYVGQSSNIVERWRNGGKNYFSSIKFFRAIQKYGRENFTHEILYENLNKEAANKIERDLIRKYDSINNAQQTAAFGQMIGQATSPIVAAVNALQSDVNGIKCKLPETVTLPYSCATAVPTQAVFNGYALGTYAGWNGCGCNNSLWG